MSLLKFNDGENFETSGTIRKEMRKDGLYVLGAGHLIPVNSNEEANQVMGMLERSHPTLKAGYVDPNGQE